MAKFFQVAPLRAGWQVADGFQGLDGFGLQQVAAAAADAGMRGRTGRDVGAWLIRLPACDAGTQARPEFRIGQGHERGQRERPCGQVLARGLSQLAGLARDVEQIVHHLEQAADAEPQAAHRFADRWLRPGQERGAFACEFERPRRLLGDSCEVVVESDGRIPPLLILQEFALAKVGQDFRKLP